MEMARDQILRLESNSFVQEFPLICFGSAEAPCGLRIFGSEFVS